MKFTSAAQTMMNAVEPLSTAMMSLLPRVGEKDKAETRSGPSTSRVRAMKTRRGMARAAGGGGTGFQLFPTVSEAGLAFRDFSRFPRPD